MPNLVSALGASGIYGIVIGLGISHALEEFARSLSGKISSCLSNNPLCLLSIITLDFPHTFRLIGYSVHSFIIL